MVNAQPVTEPVVTTSSTETMVDEINNLKLDEAKPADESVTAAESNGQAEQQQEGESQLTRLHRLCAEGDVMGVRGILSQSLELLESIDLTTGWTPMLQAIYGGQVEVVRELLLAGAYPPPPSVTSDPAILSLLYPQQPYGQQQPGALPVNGEVPQAGFHNGIHHPRMSVSGNGSHETTHKLPPIEVSRTIPCRNFPNCRYGDACIFQHPVALPAGAGPGAGPAFYPSPYPSEFVPGFAAPYIPGGFPQGAPMPQMYYPPYPPAPHMAAAGPFVPLDGQARGPSPHSAPFVPFIPASGSPAAVGVSPSGNQLALDGSTTADSPSVTPEGEPATGETPVADGVAGQPAPQLAPRQSVSGGFPGHLPFYAGNNNAGFEPRRNGHMKKMSFSASKHGGMVNARAAVLGTWTNGQPPPCVFFQNSKCRNGEMCKFPHIAADGTDCRHPDVINGTLAPAPVSLGGNNAHPNAFRGPRGRGAPSVNAGHFERHQHVQAMKAQGAAAARNAAANNNRAANDATVAAPPADSPAASDDDAQESKPTDDTSSNETKVKEQVDAASATQQKSTVTRSVPNTRAGSPNHAFGGNNFRNGRAGRVPHQNGRDNSRSTSIPAGQREVKQQKLPSADDFPALSGSTGSLMSESAVLVKPVAFNGKTAAQVLSAPAPPKPVAAPVKTKTETKTDDADKDFERVSASPSTNDVTTESDDEAVIISHTPTPATRSESKPAPLSFAAAAAAVASSEPAVLVTSTA